MKKQTIVLPGRIDQDRLEHRLMHTRETTARICEPLHVEDHVIQPMKNVSPPKWHLGHTSWFFEQFVLIPYMEGYRVFDENFNFLFNSYYNNLGDRVERHQRGFCSRPTVDEVYRYRQHVNEYLKKIFNRQLPEEVLSLIETGIHHEQQHQELLVYDIKYILGAQPLQPGYGDHFEPKPEKDVPNPWLSQEGGIYTVGTSEESFHFDNEGPEHRVILEPFQIRKNLVTNGEYLEFMQDGGYENFNLWHDDGWQFIRSNQLSAPLYWDHSDDGWSHFTMKGRTHVDPDRPVQHLSFYEASAFAAWAGGRLPTEFEWEVASGQFPWGKLWEWTYSAYLPYPGFRTAEGALGEYNGKFMVNQWVLRGSSVATPEGHARKTYRNFFSPDSRWIFSGVRLAK